MVSYGYEIHSRRHRDQQYCWKRGSVIVFENPGQNFPTKVLSWHIPQQQGQSYPPHQDSRKYFPKHIDCCCKAGGNDSRDESTSARSTVLQREKKATRGRREEQTWWYASLNWTARLKIRSGRPGQDFKSQVPDFERFLAADPDIRHRTTNSGLGPRVWLGP